MVVQDVVFPPKDKGVENTIKNWMYQFTVVRAQTKLHEEPSAFGRMVHDFTFDPADLRKELEEDRQRLGIHVTDSTLDEIRAIPSLEQLKREGEKKMLQQRFDLFCRLIEFAVFFTIWLIFFFLLKPDE